MALLISSLFTLTTGARLGERRLDDIDSDRLITAFLRTRLGDAYPLTRSSAAGSRVVFEGRRDRIRFVGHLPSHRGGGGLRGLTLSVESRGDRPALVLSVGRTPSGHEAAGSGPTESRELIANVESVRIRYFGAKNNDDNPRWSDNWLDAEQLPALIALEINASDRDWPPLVVPVRARTVEGQQHLLIDDTREAA
jgi:general secretion pathway protein J